MSLWHEVEVEIKRAEQLHGTDPIPLGMGGQEFLTTYAEEMNSTRLPRERNYPNEWDPRVKG